MKKPSSYWQLIPYIRPHSRMIVLALSCTFAFTFFWPILAWLAGEMARYIGKGDVGKILQMAGVAAVVFLLRGGAQYGQDSLMAKASLQIALDLRMKVYKHLQSLSVDYFEGSKTGDLVYRLTEEVDRIGEVINKLFHQFVPCVLQLIVVLGYMLYLNWQLTLASFIIAPLMALLIGSFGEQLLKFSRRSQQKTSNLSSQLTEVFSGIRLVQAYSAQKYELERFEIEAEQNRRAKYLAERIKALQFVVVGFLEAMSVIFLFFLGGWQISQRNLTGSDFVSYVAAVALLIDPIAIGTSNYNEFKLGEASVERVMELLTIQPTVVEEEGAMSLPEVTGKVEFMEVSFGYSDEVLALDNINLMIQPGEMLAIVGSSGAGKSTLVNLLLRFYNPTKGRIAIDGIDISKVQLDSLRRGIGIVSQETVIFSGSIGDNIAFGYKEWDLAKVEEAAKIANAHEFITELPQGYYTYVGERGVNLSGGQRQRIPIARAIFSQPRILILDEATSALDSVSETLVQKALENITKERTVLVIAHRLATVRKANRIVVLNKGQIVEVGTHEELLNLQGHYARFHAQQFFNVG